MGNIKIGCETYTWQMPGEQYKGKLDHIMGVMAQAGFTGIEPETSFLQELSDPVLMKEVLDKHGMELSVLCLVEDWLNPKETDAERASADKWIEYLEHFPDTLFLPVQMPTTRTNLVERQKNLLSCVNAIAQRAADKGIKSSYHPNSPETSIFRTEEDYKVLLNGLDSRVIKYTPDVGHMAKGGMDPVKVIREYRELVNCIHYKDMFENGEWAAMGEGIIDFETLTMDLVKTDFDGWIIFEDECDLAITDPDGVTLKDGEYINNKIRSLLK